MKKPDMRGHFKNWQVLENLPPALLYIGAIYAALFLVGSSHRLELPKLNMFQLCVLKWTCFRFHIVCGKACNCGGREGSAGENTFRNCHLDISIERLACVRGWRLRWPILWRRLSQGKISTCFGWPGCLMEFRRRKKSTLPRFLFLVVGSGFLAHWKNLAFTQSQDDKLVSIIGGILPPEDNEDNQ